MGIDPISLALIFGGSALIGGAANVIGAGEQAGAADKAAQANLQGTRESIAAQKEAAAKAQAFLKEQSGIARADLEPFRQSQLKALGQADALADANNPLYQQQRNAMTQTVQRQLAAQGLLRSKKQVDLLGNLELGIAQQRANQVNLLAGTGAVQQGAAISQGLGQGLANIQGGLGQQLGSSFSQLGQLNAQMALARGQATASAFSGVNNALQGGVQNWLMGNLLTSGKLG